MDEDKFHARIRGKTHRAPMPKLARERRRRRRVKTRRAAWIQGDSGGPIPCVLWEQSETGARIAAAHCKSLPAVFTLTAGKEVRHCQVVWRTNAVLGVRFLRAEEVPQAIAAARAAGAPQAEPPSSSLETILLGAGPRPTRAAEFAVSWIAAGVCLALIALSALLYFAGHESPSGAIWALNVCNNAGGLCRHPEFPGAGGILMAAVYITTRGMEL
jgi:hypothetical protein